MSSRPVAITNNLMAQAPHRTVLEDFPHTALHPNSREYFDKV